MFVHLVVGKLEFLEGDNLLLKLVPGVGRVGVGVEAVRRRRVSLARHQPRRPVIRVPVGGKAGVSSNMNMTDTKTYPGSLTEEPGSLTEEQEASRALVSKVGAARSRSGGVGVERYQGR
ncbi:hypothetical protein E2C01_019546 [Portunus trituberculatus]|uniref:Uncharacterized protein n=1 Tax=Portunus trituberculatus TaxID=210409 RepID=A0A5B7DY72_PORTR|nr:hypothetical protein [Portunus trituberculatus]